ncbi:MAG: DUF3034 family protein [Sedimentisphaerales bacterium]|nr:DUF3034 family protein [Sedimentisphaerales bacterium]
MAKFWAVSLIGWIVSFGGPALRAGVPLNNLKGVGGIAFNPLAYLAGNGATETEKRDTAGKDQLFGLPQFGAWHVHLGDVDIDWTTFGGAETLFDRVEVSYGREIIAPSGGETIYKNDVGAKLLVLSESGAVPAVSLGAVWKHTTFDVPNGVDDSGVDYYLAVTKLVKTLPRPVLLSGGVISTRGRTLGVLGFDDRDEALFGKIDVVPLENVPLGFEYRQGADSHDFTNADYWNAHSAWFANKHLTLVVAYVNAGDPASSTESASEKVSP